MGIACPAQSRMKLISHSAVIIPVPPSWIGICARGSSVIVDVWCITNIRESVPLKTVGTVLGLPSTCMKCFGSFNCTLCCNIVDTEAMKSHCQVNTGRTGTIFFIILKVQFGSFPFTLNILIVRSRVSPFHKRILTLLGEKKMLPDLIPGKSSGGKYLKFLLEVHPGDIKIIPKVLGLHLTAFTLKGFSTQRGKRGMSSG